MNIPNNELNTTSISILGTNDNNDDDITPTCITKTIIILCVLYTLPITQLIVPNISFSQCLCNSFLTMITWAIIDGVLSIICLTMCFFVIRYKYYNIIRWIICFLKLAWFVVGIVLISNSCLNKYCQNDTGFIIVCLLYDFIFLVTVMITTCMIYKNKLLSTV